MASKPGHKEPPRLTIFQHLEELRKRLFLSLLFFFCAFIICLIFNKDLMNVIVIPHQRALEMAGLNNPEHRKFLSITYPAPFMAMLKLALICAIFLSSPFIAYQIWKFVSAGLYPHERKIVLFFAIPSVLLFLTGCIFGYFILIPYGLYFMLTLGGTDFCQPLFSINSYLNLVLLLIIATGLVFELPLVMLFLAKIGICSAKLYASGRKYAIIIILIISMILTPPDVFSQILMAIPMFLLYEIGILLSRIFAAQKKL